MDYARRHDYGDHEDYEYGYNHAKPDYQGGNIDYRRGSYEYNKSPMRSNYSSGRDSGNLVAVYKGAKRAPSGPPPEDMKQQNSKYPENTLQRMDSIQDPGKRYILNEIIGSGVCGTVYAAVDTQAGNRPVAVKVQSLTSDTQELIVEEYRTFRDYGGHPNIPDFHGIYRKRSGKKTEPDQIWIVMELCSGGPVMDLVRELAAFEKTMREEHISYILREVIKALIYLHENNVIHRDVKGHNILLTKEGEVKLADFGLSKQTKGPNSKCKTSIGSPSWMAPEVVMSNSDPEGGYGSRVDVWSIGITAIELAEGKAPFENMHPTRGLFQIVRNPPPGLYRPANWSENFNDFIAECLEKNPENRPVMAEILMHPFFQELPDNDYILSQELKSLSQNVREEISKSRPSECIVRNGFLKTDKKELSEIMLTEDLAALEVLTEDSILDELHERLRQGHFQTYIGDVLVILNPNEIQDIYGTKHHEKYNFKSRSDNAPHIYSVADKAYQDVLHNQETQHIIITGESKSGKTSNLLHLIKHLMYLGKSTNDIGIRLTKAMSLIHAFSNAATPLNANSTRCLLQIQTTFGSTGKASGAIFWLYQLEKWRVSSFDKSQSNFHIFYYLYDALDAKNKLNDYNLPAGRQLRYLRVSDTSSSGKHTGEVRHDPLGNCLKFDEINETLSLMEMDEHAETMWKILSAILILGEIKFTEGGNSEAEIENIKVANIVADHFGLDQKKFAWALTNYCLIKKGVVVRRKHTCEEANLARDILASTLYHRLVDWMINNVNEKFSMTRTLFGDKFMISILDLFGFECFSVNKLEQLIVNTMNEQLQCYYNQRIFVWEMQEQEEEEIPIEYFHYYDNREVIDQLMGKNYGLFQVLDHASRQLQDAHYILEKVKQKSKGVHVKAVNYHEFTVAHFTGKITYNAMDIVEKNRDFVPPEMITTMRLSSHSIIKQMFTGALTRSGNLTIESTKPQQEQSKKLKRGVQEASKIRRYNTASRGQFSQSRKMRTYSATFRSVSLEILKNLSIGSGSGGTHFVRCIRSDLDGKPRGFNREIVRQQIRALAVLDTAKIRQRGYPHRIPFQEFLRRYKFLAFDFDENVEMTKDNCRLLLIRLKMEGWIIGKTKVFLKYYNEEYLSRLYETQVRKIVKIQCMLRAFLARKKLEKANVKKRENAKKAKLKKTDSVILSEHDAAVKIQKTYRGHTVRKEVMPILKGELDDNTKQFIKYYSSKWKSRSMFQVLLHYRAARYQDLVQFCQQIHLFNQTLSATLQENNQKLNLDNVDPNTTPDAFLDDIPQQVYKLPFDINTEFPYFDTNYMNDPIKLRKNATGSISSASDEENEAWDAPLRRQTVPWATQVNKKDVEVQTTFSPQRSPRRKINTGLGIIDTPFSRDPSVPLQLPPEDMPQRRRSLTPSPIHVAYKSPIKLPATNIYNSHSDLVNNNSPLPSRKKMPPPPIPINQKKWNENLDNRKKPDDFTFEDRNRNVAGIRPNPIRELQAMGRKNINNNDDSDDEPPFNFQAMLRKTPHKHDSMKRNQVYESRNASRTASRTVSRTASPLHPEPIIYARPISPFPGENETPYKTTDDPDAVTIYRSNSRMDSPEWSPNEMVRMSEKYGQEDQELEPQESQESQDPSEPLQQEEPPQTPDGVESTKVVDNETWVEGPKEPTTGVLDNAPTDDQNNYIVYEEAKVISENPDGRTIVEFAPGLVVEGYCVDL